MLGATKQREIVVVEDTGALVGRSMLVEDCRSKRNQKTVDWKAL